MKWLRMQKCRQKRKTMRKRAQRKKRNCQQNCFHSFNYIKDHASNHFFIYINSLHCIVWFFLYYLQKSVFCNVTVSNLKMFSKKSKNRQPGSAFLEYLGAQILSYVHKYFNFESYWFYREIKNVFFSVQFASI